MSQKKGLLAAKDIPYNKEDHKPGLLPHPIKMKDYTKTNISEDQRTVFQHDRDAILYSRSFRRLMHKTQVTYPGTEKDEHTRTRLTHTLEVVQLSRTLCRDLSLNEDLAEAIALGHDIGHTPFGHEGEAYLDKVLHGWEIVKNDETLKQYETSFLEKYELTNLNIGFKHNFQSVRMLLFWDGEYYDSDENTWKRGLNISYKTLEGILKHSRIRYKNGQKKGELYQYAEIINDKVLKTCLGFDFAILSLEGQIVGLADEIAQVCHDLEDAVHADYSVKKHLYERITKIINSKECHEIYESLINEKFIKISDKKMNEMNKYEIKIIKERVHSFISWVIGYLLGYAKKEIEYKVNNYILNKSKYNYELFPLTEELAGEDTTLKNNQLYKCMKSLQQTYIINNIRINRENSKSDFILKAIIDAYLSVPKRLPDTVLVRYSEICEIKSITDELNKLKRNFTQPANIRYIYNGIWDQSCLKLIRTDPKFIRILIDYIATMTDQYALNEYKMLYLQDPAHRYSI